MIPLVEFVLTPRDEDMNPILGLGSRHLTKNFFITSCSPPATHFLKSFQISNPGSRSWKLKSRVRVEEISCPEYYMVEKRAKFIANPLPIRDSQPLRFPPLNFSTFAPSSRHISRIAFSAWIRPSLIERCYLIFSLFLGKYYTKIIMKFQYLPIKLQITPTREAHVSQLNNPLFQSIIVEIALIFDQLFI